MLYVKRNENGTVSVNARKINETWVEFTLPAGEVDEANLTWVLGEPLPVVDPVKVSEKARIGAKRIRDESLISNTYTLPDGSVYQVRPQDLPNFDIVIADGVSEEWVLADNTVRLTTIAELQEILSNGVAQGKAIWTTYKNTIKEL